MKKKFICINLITLLFPCLAGCSGDLDRNDIAKITYIDWSYGLRQTYSLDFKTNTYSIKEKERDFSEDNYRLFNILDISGSFSEENVKDFLKAYAKCGVSKLQRVYGFTSYPTGWSLRIDYTDGTYLKSDGYGYSLYGLEKDTREIFEKLGICCYNLFGYYVFLGTDLQDSTFKFDYKPTIYCIPEINGESNLFKTQVPLPLKEGNYRWNGTEQSNVDLYTLNLNNRKNDLIHGGNYTLHSDVNGQLFLPDKRTKEGNLNELTVNSYDFNPDLTNKREELHLKAETKRPADYKPPALTGEYTEEYFNYVDLKENRIYTIDYAFDNGDFYQYTFNTYTDRKKILYGRYAPRLGENDFGYLDIFEDGTFKYHFYKDFYTLINHYNQEGELYDIDFGYTEEERDFEGTYRFEEFDGVEKLVLDMGEDGIIVYDYFYVYFMGDIHNSTFTYLQCAKTPDYYVNRDSSNIRYTLRHIDDEDL